MNGAEMTAHGRPGEWARIRGVANPLWPLPVCTFFCGAFFASVFASGSPHVRVACAAALAASLAAAAWVWRRGVARAESYFAGARGEETVAAVLEAMPARGHVFHDFGKDLSLKTDHLVLLPGGAFAVETKCWSGAVTVENGAVKVDGAEPSRDPLDQAAAEAAAASARLAAAGWKGGATPVLCFASGTLEPAASGAVVRGVAVLNVSELSSWLLSRPPVCGGDELDRVAGILETEK